MHCWRNHRSSGDRLGVRPIFEPRVGSHDSDLEAHTLRMVQGPATTPLRQSISSSRVQFVEGRLQFSLQQAFLQGRDLSFHDGTDCDMVLDQLVGADARLHRSRRVNPAVQPQYLVAVFMQ